MNTNNIKSNIYKANDYCVDGRVYIGNGLSSMKVKIKKLDSNAVIPTRGSEESAGMDLYSCASDRIIIMPHETVTIHTGIAVEFPKGIFGGIFARSGLSCKKGLALANKVGVVDSDYRGEVIVALHNDSDVPQTIEPMERVAQLILLPYIPIELEEVEELSDTERGTGGFGSTGGF